MKNAGKMITQQSKVVRYGYPLVRYVKVNDLKNVN